MNTRRMCLWNTKQWMQEKMQKWCFDLWRFEPLCHGIIFSALLIHVVNVKDILEYFSFRKNNKDSICTAVYMRNTLHTFEELSHLEKLRDIPNFQELYWKSTAGFLINDSPSQHQQMEVIQLMTWRRWKQ